MMSQKAVLVTAGLLLSAAVASFAWWSLHGSLDPQGPTPQSSLDAAPSAIPTTSDLTTADDSAAVPLEASAERAEVGSNGNAARPLPDDAEWVQVTVVDRDSDTPVPGAKVLWSDEQSWQSLIRKDPRFASSTSGDRCQRLPEYLAELAGWQTIADEHGRVRVTLREHTNAVGMHDDRYGTLHLVANSVPPPQGYRLRLQPDLALTVAVTDDRGEPCADVPLQVVPHDDKGVPHGDFVWNTHGETDAQGLATIPHLQQLVQALRLEGDLRGLGPQPPPTWKVRSRTSPDRDRGIAFAIDAPPTDPVQLRLGPCGSIRATAVFNGQPMRSFHSAELSLAESEADQHGFTAEFERTAVVGPDGAAVWHHVPLGQQYTIRSPHAGLHTRVAGPTTARQQVEVVLTPPADAVILRGRALDPQRQPLADTDLQVMAKGPRLRRNLSIRTDAEGRFLVQLTTTDTDLKADAVALLHVLENAEPWRCDLLPRTLRPGIEDLGEVVLAPGPIVVAGRYTEGGQPFTGKVWLRFDREEPATEKRPKPRWRYFDEVQQRQDGDRFTVRGNLPPGRYRLTPQGPRNLPLDPIEFRLGQTDLEVRIDSGAQLAASALMPEHAPVDSLKVELVGTRPDPKSGAPGRHECSPNHEQDERYQLRWNAVPAGVYSLQLQLSTAATPIVRIDDVVVPPPAGGDPRLVDIDLRNLVRVVSAQVVTTSGEPADDADGVVFPIGLNPDSDWPGHRFWSPRWRMLLPTAMTTMLVTVLDHQPQQLTVSGDRLVVPAEPWPRVLATIADLPPELAGANFLAKLKPIHEMVGMCHHRYGSEARGFWLQPQNDTAMENGTFAMAIGDGPHRPQLWLTTDDQAHEVEVAGPTTVLANAGRITLSVTPEAWAKAKAKFQAANPPKK